MAEEESSGFHAGCMAGPHTTTGSEVVVICWKMERTRTLRVPACTSDRGQQ